MSVKKRKRDFAMLSIEAAGDRRTRIILNGTDISNQCRKIVFTHEAGKIPAVSLNLVVNRFGCLLEHPAVPMGLVQDDA